MRNPCVVDQDLDTLFGKEFLENLPDLPLVRNIAGVRRALPARIGDLFRGHFRLLPVDIGDAHRGPVGRETQGDRLPNAAAAAGHDGDFTVESKILAAARAVQSEIPLYHGIKSS